ncbi:MAG TPA: NADH-quinone oxidoreductase subunit C, partial [Thermoanaerobaculia bacterium]|nr:NADH-quinone oxidoreductase subunit C [Thermoanaerobaculia bacterium]
MSAVATPSFSAPAERLRNSLSSSRFSEKVEVRDLDLPTIEVAPADWPALAGWLRDDPECRYDLFLDLAGVDNLKRAGQKTRFEAVVHLHSLPRNEHARVKVLLPDGAPPSLPTVREIWPAADWFE